MQTILNQSTTHAARPTDTAVIIPVYFPARVRQTAAARLLRETLLAYRQMVTDPAGIFLTVDGSPAGAATARALARTTGVRCICQPHNRGKLAAIRAAAAELREVPGWRYLAVVDQDGDHRANELPNFLKAIRHVEHGAGTDQVLALGRRISRHRPMGLLRGELEELANRMLLDALHYDAARCGRPLRLEFATTHDEFPDFHSGYKVFTRKTALAVFTGKPHLAGTAPACYYRHACEAVMSVEAIKSGARLVQVNRTTLNEQPLTTFGLMNQRRLAADMIIWPCKRLKVPAAFVEQWLGHHAPRLLLGTLVPQGRNELLAVMRLVLAAYPASKRRLSPMSFKAGRPLLI